MTFGGAKFWAMIVDDFIDYFWSYFMKSKDQLKSKVVELVEEIKDKRSFVKYVRIDNSGQKHQR
jgi:hypothetical protein